MTQVCLISAETTPVADRTAVVFGASGGIGRAIVERLLSHGRYAVIHAGSRQACDDFSRPVRPFQFDLDDEDGIALAARNFGSPDLLVIASGMLHDAAAGIAPEKYFLAIEAEAMSRVYALNAIGPALIAKHVLPLLPRDRKAVFAVLSARVGSIGDNRLGGWHAYRASKAALNMLVRNLAIEMGRTHPHAIIVALHPGTVDSQLSKPFQHGVAAEKLFSPERSSEYLLRVIEGLTPVDSGGHFAWDGTRLPD